MVLILPVLPSDSEHGHRHHLGSADTTCFEPRAIEFTGGNACMHFRADQIAHRMLIVEQQRTTESCVAYSSTRHRVGSHIESLPMPLIGYENMKAI